ncbi:MAG TPA: polysaccharide deacetylase family protein [Casimicrobiaceae bacterium]|nr:polysaccharide deacetylase family protein [Casimicrobiaceae bacterium]
MPSVSERDAFSTHLVRAALAVASPAGARARLSVLIHHRVRREPDPLFPGEIDAARFDAQLRLLARLFNVIPLRDAVPMLTAGTLPARAACITFDDGYADNCEVALPILARHGLEAAFFVSTGYLDGGLMWNDAIIESIRGARGKRLDLTPIGLRAFAIETLDEKHGAISELIAGAKYLDPSEREKRCAAIRDLANVDVPRDLMMRSDQVRALHAAGMDIGAHTVSHPILVRIDKEEARREIAEGKSALETIIDAPVRHFAYPNGVPGVDYGRAHVEIVRELGFDAAFSTACGAASRRSDMFQLPRFTPWDRTPLRIGARFVRNLSAQVAVA